MTEDSPRDANAERLIARGIVRKYIQLGTRFAVGKDVYAELMADDIYFAIVDARDAALREARQETEKWQRECYKAEHSLRDARAEIEHRERWTEEVRVGVDWMRGEIESLTQALADKERETIERCAQVCDEAANLARSTIRKYTAITAHDVAILKTSEDLAISIRALADRAPEAKP